MASGTITSWQIAREKVGEVTFYILGLQNHMKSKDTCSLEENLWQT